MRLPKESELSREQKEVCFAPASGPMLVVGPPGSGKTVVAVFRQRALLKKESKVATLVFNKVLSRYTTSEKTFLTWVKGWWKATTRRSAPLVNGEQFALDWERMRIEAGDGAKSDVQERGDWGHLILDEAQDYPPVAHEFLSAVQSLVERSPGARRAPSVCILADENQRLTDRNSTLEQIRRAYLLAHQDTYHLKRNYRNTKEIAELAAHFYAGLASGVPEPPVRRGDRPKLLVTSGIDEAVDRIAKYAALHEDEEIGVLVQFDGTRKKLFNKLVHRLKGKSVAVQTYGSQDPEHQDAGKLRFDHPGTLTILCFGSAKGLEFDTVFLPELQTVPSDSSQRDQVRMRLYVMTSRARKGLWLMVSDSAGTSGIWNLLPAADSGLVEVLR